MVFGSDGIFVTERIEPKTVLHLTIIKKIEMVSLKIVLPYQVLILHALPSLLKWIDANLTGLIVILT